MIELNTRHASALTHWFQPERPGHLIGLHVIHTGHGSFRVDRFPNPRAVIVQAGVDYVLAGNPEAFGRSALRDISGWMEVRDEAILRRLRAPLTTAERLVLELTNSPVCPPTNGCYARRLSRADRHRLSASRQRLAGFVILGEVPQGLRRAGGHGRLLS